MLRTLWNAGDVPARESVLIEPLARAAGEKVSAATSAVIGATTGGAMTIGDATEGAAGVTGVAATTVGGAAGGTTLDIVVASLGAGAVGSEGCVAATAVAAPTGETTGMAGDGIGATGGATATGGGVTTAGTFATDGWTVGVTLGVSGAARVSGATGVVGAGTAGTVTGVSDTISISNWAGGLMIGGKAGGRFAAAPIKAVTALGTCSMTGMTVNLPLL